jgi:hypothetical protein
VLACTWNVNETKPSRPGLELYLGERVKDAQLVLVGLQVSLNGSTASASASHYLSHMCSYVFTGTDAHAQVRPWRLSAQTDLQRSRTGKREALAHTYTQSWARSHHCCCCCCCSAPSAL